jgi:hypothetical protein
MSDWHEHSCPRCGERWGDSKCRYPGRDPLLCPACYTAENEMRARGVNTRVLFDVRGARGRWGDQ